MVNYQKLYAYLAGQIDDTLQMIAGEITKGDCGYSALNAVGDKLKHALLAAEELYLDETEEE